MLILKILFHLCLFEGLSSEFQGQNNEICQVCDCAEPNVDCKGLKLTKISFILPKDTGNVDFSKNSISSLEKGIRWSSSIVEINLSRNKISYIQPGEEIETSMKINVLHFNRRFLNKVCEQGANFSVIEKLRKTFK